MILDSQSIMHVRGPSVDFDRENLRRPENEPFCWPAFGPSQNFSINGDGWTRDGPLMQVQVGIEGELIEAKERVLSGTWTNSRKIKRRVRSRVRFRAKKEHLERF